MKTKERHHLKENELAQTIAAARAFVDPRRPQLGGALIVLVILAATAIGILIVRGRTEARAQDLLADAMVVLDAPVQPPTPGLAEEGKPAPPPTQQPGTYPTEEAKLQAALPKLKAAADGYPESHAGITARYHLASALVELGRHKEALDEYDGVISHGGDDLYGRMARLGKAEAHVRLGQYEPAIGIYKELADKEDADLPADAILIQLARAYQAAGNTEEAKKTFSRIVHEHPTSPFSAEAGKAMMN